MEDRVGKGNLGEVAPVPGLQRVGGLDMWVFSKQVLTRLLRAGVPGLAPEPP